MQGKIPHGSRRSLVPWPVPLPVAAVSAIVAFVLWLSGTAPLGLLAATATTPEFLFALTAVILVGLVAATSIALASYHATPFANLRNGHILIAGGAGFIGSHIAARLVSEGQRVRILNNLSGGKLPNIEPIIDAVEFIEGNIWDTVRRAVEDVDVDVIFHEAAEPSVPRSIADPAATFANNLGGTLNVLTAARDAGMSRVVFAFTCAIYGDDPQLPKREALASAPLSPYAMSKLIGDGQHGPGNPRPDAAGQCDPGLRIGPNGKYPAFAGRCFRGARCAGLHGAR